MSLSRTDRGTRAQAEKVHYLTPACAFSGRVWQKKKMAVTTEQTPSEFISDPWVSLAIKEIQEQYGDVVAVKSKTLRKFGRTANASSGTVTVMTLPSSELNETFLTSNKIDYIVSSSTGDVGTLSVEGHYYDADNNLIFATQNITLNGQTPAALTTSLSRCSRIYVANGTFQSPASNLVGNIYAYASTSVTVTAGVPQTASAVKCMVAAGQNQSEKCATSFSYQDYCIITGVYAGISKGNSNVNVDIDMEYRAQGGVWRPLGLEMSLRTASQSTYSQQLAPYAIVPPNSDLRMVATASADNTTVSGHWQSFLAIKQS